MTAFSVERVSKVHHWNENPFTFYMTRDVPLRFESAHYEESLEFFSIKVQQGASTSRFQHARAGDPVPVGRKARGTIQVRDLLLARNLYLYQCGDGSRAVSQPYQGSDELWALREGCACVWREHDERSRRRVNHRRGIAVQRHSRCGCSSQAGLLLDSYARAISEAEGHSRKSSCRRSILHWTA